MVNNLIIIGVVIDLVIFGGTVAGVIQLPGAPDCRDDPSNFICSCPSGFEKSRTGAVIEYTCIPTRTEIPYDFPLSVDDPQWEGKFLSYAKDYVRANFQECNMVDCDGGFIDIAYLTEGGFQGTPTHGYVECGEPLSKLTGQYWWRVVFDLNDGSIHPNIDTFCKSR